MDFDYKPINTLTYQMKQALCVGHRKILIEKEIDDDCVLEVIYYVNKLLELDNISEDKKPIEFIINSYGGSVDTGFLIINQIEYLKGLGYNVITTNAGTALSMGFIIGISGSERRCYKYSRYMVHDVSCYGGWERLDQTADRVKENIELRNILYDIITERTKITREDLINWQERKIDKYFSSKEALSLNITDKII